MMNSLRKFLTITFLAVSILILGLSDDLISAQSSAPGPMVPLTPAEQAWLAEHPEIVLGTTTEYSPMVIKRADGTYVGLLVDIYEQINRHLNTKIRLHIEDSWADVQEKAQNKEIDGLAMGGKDPSRDVLYNPTDVIVPTYFSVFARFQNEYPLMRFSDLKGMRIGYKRAARPTRSLLEKLPSAILKPYDSHETMTQALLSKEIDVIVAWMSYDHWRKQKLQGTIDNILLIKEHPIEMVTYIRKDWPELIPILNKAISALQQDELPRIIDKWFGQWPQRSISTKVPLTREERAWIDQKHTVRVRFVDWPPYLILKDNGPPQGIVIEYLKLIEKRTGITFKNEVTDQPFAEFLESMKQRQGPDMTAVIVPTPEREQYLSFTETYISSPYVIFIRGQDKPILDISGLTGKTLAVPRGFVIHDQLVRDYPKIRLALFDSDEGALQAVATGQVDAYIGNLTAASHIIHRRGFSSLQVTASSPFKDQSLAMGNRNDWPELTSIINKALASITEEEKTAIRNKYLAIKYERGIEKAEVLKWVMIVGGAASGIVLIFLFWNRQLSREIIKRKQTEEYLKQARDEADEANQAKSVFLANMSHELRTPLNAILGFSGMLAREQKATADQQEKLTVINRSGEHLLAMINDVLELSKIEAGRVELEVEVFDLPRMLEDIGRIFELRAQNAGLSFELSLDVELPRYVRADAGKLRQTLINLLSNAVMFTDQGGGISLRARSTPMPADPAMLRLQMEVEDSGQGIAPELLERIFEPFYQAGKTKNSSKGTGLGLSISKSFVEMMDGQISIDSTPDKGSLFRVEVPVTLAEAAEVVDGESAGTAVLALAPGQPARRILVVEDNRENRLLLSSLLREAGFEIREAENGKEAIDLFEQWQPHLIWMDMRMPVVNGYEATRRIRHLVGGKAVKIVAITASAFKEQHQDILAAGCDEVVYKPFRDHEIFEAMARLLDLKYLYKDMGTEVTRKEGIKLTAEMLTGLPPDLLRDLDETTLALNREAALEVIARIAGRAPEVAAGLKELVDNYQMVELRDLLEEKD
jgi:signal transduction histidine kinase/DNA-binding response OmpR family regulator